MSTPSPAELADAFGLVEISDASLTPWASVHEAKTSDGNRVVVKRTATNEDHAAAMADWTRAMRAAGINVVVPDDIGRSNPQQVTDDWWVVYPFIEGRPYRSNNAEDLTAAGSLLGQIHSTPFEPRLLARLRSYQWPETTRAEVDRDLTTLAEVFDANLGQRAAAADAATSRLANRWWDTSLPALRTADEESPLPRTGVSSDFKANNLIFDADTPTLVDPDNGGFEPRLIDLALAFVLFHNECPTAPGRLFTPEEWRTFTSAYFQHVALTDRELALWPAALDHMLWEEGTWVLEDNDAVAWSDPRQRGYLGDLATVDPDRYPLHA